jgi:hypothetical protein
MPEARWVDAQALADMLGVSRDFVYEHADELDARRLGSGPRARLRFDVQKALACYAVKESKPATPAPKAAPRRRRRGRSGTSVELLPIRGREPAQEAA